MNKVTIDTDQFSWPGGVLTGYVNALCECGETINGANLHALLSNVGVHECKPLKGTIECTRCDATFTERFRANDPRTVEYGAFVRTHTH